jgi:hypothetical protein
MTAWQEIRRCGWLIALAIGGLLLRRLWGGLLPPDEIVLVYKVSLTALSLLSFHLVRVQLFPYIRLSEATLPEAVLIGLLGAAWVIGTTLGL